MNLFFRAAKILSAAAALAISSHAAAQEPASVYPSRPVRFIVPYAAGGVTDSVARMVATRLSQDWKQPVIVENRIGASGVIGNEMVVKSPPDGYTVLIGIPQLIQAPALVANLPYDVFRDLAPVSMIMRTSLAMMVPSSSGVTSVQQFITLAKSGTRKMNYGSPGVGTTPHLFGEQFKAINGNLDIIHVPFKGNAQIVPELLSARLDMAFLDTVAARAQMSAGTLRVLALTGTSRSLQLPNVPTLAELGYAGFETVSWVGAFVPSATPRDVVARISAAMGQVLRAPDVVTRFAEMGVEASPSTPAEFNAVLRADAPRWVSMIQRAGIKPE